MPSLCLKKPARRSTRGEKYLQPAGPVHLSKALISAALQPVIGRPLARPAVGSRAPVAGLLMPWPCLRLRRFCVAVLMVLTGGSVAVVGSWLPGGGGYGFVAVAGRLARDGFVGLAACRPAMARPLIERRDLNPADSRRPLQPVQPLLRRGLRCRKCPSGAPNSLLSSFSRVISVGLPGAVFRVLRHNPLVRRLRRSWVFESSTQSGASWLVRLCRRTLVRRPRCSWVFESSTKSGAFRCGRAAEP